MHYQTTDAASALPHLMGPHLLALGRRLTPRRRGAPAPSWTEPAPFAPAGAAAFQPPSGPPSGPLPAPPRSGAPPSCAATPSWAAAALAALPKSLARLERATRSLLARRRAPKPTPQGAPESSAASSANSPRHNSGGTLPPLTAYPEGLLTFDAAGTIAAANPAAHRILGAAPGALPGQCGQRYFSHLVGLLQVGPSHVPLGAVTDPQGRPLAAEGTFIAAQQGRTLQRSAVLRDLSEQVLMERNILGASERERRQIGQELYDGVVQQIAANKMLAQLLAQQLLLQDSPLATQAQKMAQNLHQALQQASSLVRGLVPLGVFDQGLSQAMQRLAAQTEASSPARCLLICAEGADIADPEVAMHLYHIAQEAVANALQHGQARTITLSLTRDGHTALLSLVDDGVGFAENAALPHSGLGLRAIRHRAQLIGAHLEILSSPQRGCQIHCRLLHCYPTTLPSP